MNTAPQFWNTKNIMSTILVPLGWLYIGLSKIRTLISAPYKASVPVVCVGNITVGGTGKTPVCMMIATDLKKAGYKTVYIVSKGYGGSITKPTKVDVNIHTADLVGDEPLLMGHGFNVVISKCRRAGVKYAEQLGADYIIMDDGLQNPTVHKNKNIVVIDSLQGFSNERIFPAGPLREYPQKPLKNSDAIILTSPNKNIQLDMDSVNITAMKDKIYTAYFKVTKLPFKDRQSVVAFAGIGNPEKFFESVRACGYPIRAKASYPDHHSYTNSDLSDLHGIANKAQAKLITTEKDFVRLNPTQQKNITVLPITLTISPKNLITKIVKDS